jgi:hypothetical protein
MVGTGGPPIRTRAGLVAHQSATVYRFSVSG